VGSPFRGIALAFTVSAVCVSVLFTCDLGPVPDQETGVAGEFVLRLGYDLDDQFLGDELSARGDGAVQGVSLVQLPDDAAGVRGVRGLKRLEGVVLRFFDVGSYFVVIGCHLVRSLL